MSYTSADLRRLAKKRRSRANLDEVKSDLEEMEEMKDSLDTWLEKARAIREDITELLDQQEEMDGDIFGPDAIDAIISATTQLEAALPEDGGIATGFVEYYDNAVSSCDDLETQLDDREIDVETRDETWGEVTDNLVNMADALDEISSLGTKKTEPGGE